MKNGPVQTPSLLPLLNTYNDNNTNNSSTSASLFQFSPPQPSPSLAFDSFNLPQIINFIISLTEKYASILKILEIYDGIHNLINSIPQFTNSSNDTNNFLHNNASNLA